VPEPGGQSSPPHVDCVIVVVTYNSAGSLGSMLASLPAACGGLSTRCIVVDNASSDDTVAIARARTDVTVVEAGSNLGYSGAINLARTLAGPRSSLLIVNPDVELEPGAVESLHEALGGSCVGMAVPRLFNTDGDIYPTIRHYPSVTRTLGDALFGARLASRPGWLSEPVRDLNAYAEPHDVAWASGAVMLVSAPCDAAVGAWDSERFFLYAEETDYAIRARRHGYRVRYVPSARVRHDEGGSGRNAALLALLSVNRVRCYEKYHRRSETALFRAAIALGHLLRAFRSSDRKALVAVCRRSRWRDLPGGIA
jgi:GT2 family glycosyltransferase